MQLYPVSGVFWEQTYRLFAQLYGKFTRLDLRWNVVCLGLKPQQDNQIQK